MNHKDWTRRDFMAQSTLALSALGAIGHGSVSAKPYRHMEDLAMELEEFVGQPVNEVPTPALLIDLDIFERNMATMRDACSARGRFCRPHGKAHKSPIVAKKQIAYGAHGQCAAKLGEAEVLVHGGIKDVLITAPVVGPRKIERLLALDALTPDIKVVADSSENLSALSVAATAKSRKLKVLIEVNVGQNRTGVDTPEEAVALARQIAKEPGLELAGIQGYGGSNQHIIAFENRRAIELLALERAVAARKAVERAGFAVGILTVGGTGTYNIDTEVPEVTEIQPGSFIFMDSHYSSIGGPNNAEFTDFGNSLSVLTTVISHPSKGRAITDGGNKALSTDESMPVPKGLTGIAYWPGGDEYGILSLKKPNRDLNVGDKVEFIPGHCDTTVNLYNFFFGVRNGVVEAVWPIEGRGRTD
jgi:D-serine deaminase-like pyridoxal phosphate-dependent protein